MYIPKVTPEAKLGYQIFGGIVAAALIVGLLIGSLTA